MIKIDRVLEINVRDFARDLNVFYKKSKAIRNIGQTENSRNRPCSDRRTVCKYGDTVTISLERHIFICVRRSNTWRVFRHNSSHKIDKCVCIGDSDVLVLQRNNHISLQAFDRINKNKHLNEIRLLRRQDLSSNALFFCVHKGSIYIVDRNGALWQTDVKDCLNGGISPKKINHFNFQKGNQVYYFKVKNGDTLIIAHCVDEEGKEVNTIMYNFATKQLEEIRLSVSPGVNLEEKAKYINCLDFNDNYIVVLFSTNEVAVYQKGGKMNKYKFFKYLDKNKSNVLKYFKNKSLHEVEECTSGDASDDASDCPSNGADKVKRISSLQMCEDNTLLLTYSERFLPDAEDNGSNYKYSSLVKSVTSKLNLYCNEIENFFLLRFLYQDKFSNNSLLYDINEQLIKRHNMHMCFVNLRGVRTNTESINLDDGIYALYGETIQILNSRLSRMGSFADEDNSADSPNGAGAEQKRQEILTLRAYLDVHDISQNKRKIFINALSEDTSEKGFMNMDFLKDITKNKSRSDDVQPCSNIYLCSIDDYYVILENTEDDFNLILYKIKFLNMSEFLIHLFFYNYHDAVLAAEQNGMASLHQLFVYSIYDYGGRYFEAPLSDFQCLFQIKNLFDFLERAVTYDPFFFREEDDPNIIEMLNLKNNGIGQYKYVPTNLNKNEENNNYHNMFYLLNESGDNEVTSKYVNNYYNVKRVSSANLMQHVDINIQMLKLKTVLCISLRSVLYLLGDAQSVGEVKSFGDVIVTSDESDDGNHTDEESYFLTRLIKNKVRKRRRKRPQGARKGRQATMHMDGHTSEPPNEGEPQDESDRDDKNSGSGYSEEKKNRISEIWGLSIDQADLSGVESSSSSEAGDSVRRGKGSISASNSLKIHNDEVKRRVPHSIFLHDVDYNSFREFRKPVEKNEIVKTKLKLYRKEILRQIYKYKMYSYLMKLLDRERRKGSNHSGCDTSRGENQHPPNLNSDKHNRYSNKNKLSDIFNMFKKNINDSTKMGEEDNMNRTASSEGFTQSSAEVKASNIYIISWTKFKYYYTPFDIVKYFVINQNYVLVKILYKYFRFFVNHNWQRIFDYIPVNTKVEDFFLLLPRVKAPEGNKLHPGGGESLLPGKALHDEYTHNRVSNPVDDACVDAGGGTICLSSNLAKRDETDEEEEYAKWTRENHLPKGFSNHYEIHSDDHAFFEFFFSRCIAIMKRTRLVKSRLLPFVYVCLQQISGDNIYDLFKYDPVLKRLTFDESYFCQSYPYQSATVQTVLRVGEENPSAVTRDSRNTHSRVAPGREQLGLHRESRVEAPNFGDPLWIKKNLQVQIKKDNIPRKNVLLIYSFFTLLKQYVLCKENHKNVKFDDFVLMDVYTRLCLILEFDIKYMSLESDQDGYIKVFYDTLEEFLSNYHFIDEHIACAGTDKCRLFTKEIVNLVYEKPKNLLESIYFNLLYSSQQIFVLFCLKTLRLLQGRNGHNGAEREGKGKKHNATWSSHLTWSECFGQREITIGRSPIRASAKGVLGRYTQSKRKTELDKIFVFLKYIYYAYKHRAILRNDYEFAVLFLVIFYKYMHINLLHFISILGDFYNLLPRQIVEGPNQGVESLQTGTSSQGEELFDLGELFRSEECNNKAVIYDEHLSRIVGDDCEDAAGGCQSWGSTSVQAASMVNPSSEATPMVEKLLDVFEKDLNALELIKYLKKDFAQHAEDEIKVEIDMIVSSRNSKTKTVLNIFTLFKKIVTCTQYKDTNFTKNCFQLYHNLFYLVDIHTFFHILFYIILFHSNDFEYLTNLLSFFQRYYKEGSGEGPLHTETPPCGERWGDLLHYLLLNRAKVVTINENFEHLYKFLKHIYSKRREGFLSHLADQSKDLLTNLKMLRYMQIFANRKGEREKESGPSSMSHYVARQQTQKRASNEDIYKSFSKLISQSYERIAPNDVNLEEGAKKKTRNTYRPPFYKNILYDSYVRIAIEKNRFHIFRNVMQNDLTICYNRRRTLKLIKLLQLEKDHLRDSLLFVICTLQLHRKVQILPFYLILFLILFQNDQLGKDQKGALHNAIMYYAECSNRSASYVYNFGMSLIAYFSLNHPECIPHLYKSVFSKREYFNPATRPPKGQRLNWNSMHDSFLSLYDFLQDSKIKSHRRSDGDLRSNQGRSGGNNNYHPGVLQEGRGNATECPLQGGSVRSDQTSRNISELTSEHPHFGSARDHDAGEMNRITKAFCKLTETADASRGRLRSQRNYQIPLEELVHTAREEPMDPYEHTFDEEDYLGDVKLQVVIEMFQGENNPLENQIDECDEKCDGKCDDECDNACGKSPGESGRRRGESNQSNKELDQLEDICTGTDFEEMGKSSGESASERGAAEEGGAHKGSDTCESDDTDETGEADDTDDANLANDDRGRRHLMDHSERLARGNPPKGGSSEEGEEIPHMIRRSSAWGKEEADFPSNDISRHTQRKGKRDSQSRNALTYLLKKARNRINKHNVAKWDVAYITRTVDVVKRALKRNENKLKGMDSTLHVHHFNTRGEDHYHQKGKTAEKSNIYNSLLISDLYFAFLYFLQVEDYSFIYTFVKKIILNNSILIDKKMGIIERLLLSMYSYYAQMGEAKEEGVHPEASKGMPPFLRKILNILVITKYLLLQLKANKLSKIDLQKIFVEDSYKKVLVEKFDKERCEKILQVLIKVGDISRMALLDMNVHMGRNNDTVVYDLRWQDGPKEIGSMVQKHLSEKNTIAEDLNDHKRFQFLFEIEVEKQMITHFQRSEKNALLIYITTHLDYLNFNLHFVRKIVFYMYETCLYFLCPAVYFLRTSFYDFSMGNLFSSLSRVVKRLSRLEVVTKLLELRYVWICLEAATADVKEEKKTPTGDLLPQCIEEGEPRESLSKMNAAKILYTSNILNPFNFHLKEAQPDNPELDQLICDHVKEAPKEVQTYKLGKEGAYCLVTYLWNKFNIMPQLHDFCFLLKGLNVQLDPFYYASEENHQVIQELFDASEDDYAKHSLLFTLLQNRDCIYPFEIKKVKNNLSHFFYTNEKHHKCFLDFYLYRNALKMGNLKKVTTLLFTHLLKRPLNDFCRNIEFNFTKWMFLDRRRMEKFLHFYNVMDRLGMDNPGVLLQLVTYNLYRVEYLLFLHLVQCDGEGDPASASRVLLKLLMVLFFSSRKNSDATFSVNDFFYFCAAEPQGGGDLPTLEHYSPGDIALEGEFCLYDDVAMGGEEVHEASAVAKVSQVSRVTEAEDPKVFKTRSGSSEETDDELYIDKRMEVHDDGDDNFADIVDAQMDGAEQNFQDSSSVVSIPLITVNDESTSAGEHYAYTDQEKSLIADINNFFQKDDGVGGAEDCEDDNGVPRGRGSPEVIQVEVDERTIGQIEKGCKGERGGKGEQGEKTEASELTELTKHHQLRNAVVSFCRQRITLQEIIERVIRNELKAILFLRFSSRVTVFSLYDKAKQIDHFLRSLGGRNVFFSLQMMAILLLRNKRRRSRNRFIFHFFALLHVLHLVREGKTGQQSEHSSQHSSQQLGGQTSEEPPRGQDRDHTSGTPTEDNIPNQDDHVQNKQSLLKSLTVLLLINLSNIFLPTVNKLYFLEEKQHVLFDNERKELCTKHDVADFVRIILNLVDETYVKGYEFVYLSLLLLIEYVVELLCDDSDVVVPPTMAHIFKCKKVQKFLDDYARGYHSAGYGKTEQEQGKTEQTKQTKQMKRNVFTHFLNQQAYDRIRSMMSRIYLKLLSNCDKSIVLVCKIVIGNRLNLEDEVELFKKIKSTILLFFTSNYSQIKSNKQKVLLQSKIKRDTSDLFQTKIASFIKVLLVIMHYNIDSFKDWEYYETIKQIITDGEWFRIFDAKYARESVEMNFLCKRYTRRGHLYGVQGGAQLSARRSAGVTTPMEDTPNVGNNTNEGISDSSASPHAPARHLEVAQPLEEDDDEVAHVEDSHNSDTSNGSCAKVNKTVLFYLQSFTDREESATQKEVDSGDTQGLLSSNEVVQGKSPWSSGSLDRSNDHHVGEQFEGEESSNKTANKSQTEEVMSEVVPTAMKGLSQQSSGNNLVGPPHNGDNAVLDGGTPYGEHLHEEHLQEEYPHEEDPFQFNTSKVRETILNDYGKGFLSKYINKLTTKEECEERLKQVWRKSKMMDLVKYAAYILRYWNIEIEELQKGEREEAFQILIFFANHFHFFENLIKYKIVLKLYMHNELNLADELLGQKSRMWSWYRNDVKIKSSIEEYLMKDICYNDFFTGKGNNETFLRSFNQVLRRDHWTSGPLSRREGEPILTPPTSCFYLMNYHNNKFNGAFFKSIYMQHYSFRKYCKDARGGKHLGGYLPRETQLDTASASHPGKHTTDSQETKHNQPNGSNKPNHTYHLRHVQGHSPKEESSTQKSTNHFPLFYLSFMDLYARTADVYDFYFQAVIFKLMKEEELHLTKAKEYQEDLQTYLQNMLNQYDLYLMLLHYQLFTFHSVCSNNTCTNFLNRREQKLVLYLWVRLTQDLMKKYR
ncbi:hypothetical protein C922_04269 [Plasmodium inui San Antonio 1]|uniref:Uncharacterized protein n=1 Tax=Plasmodium inui San Antonio 1 TaxID=1237626 RepID=W7AJ46_9APIC|nr:hypothetical protein C922_04269 [Plasmodium inui San Antonio 1]EUD65326.1 hypothetical protein C922_04269 [Plasmodium inui San Antonio 1]